MTTEYVKVDLNNEQKERVLEHASYLLSETTKADLNNKRKKWIRFQPHFLGSIIGELCYYFNRCEDDYEFYILDSLISNLEHYEYLSKQG